MIIGEKNLIIGKLYSIISEFSITTYNYIEKQINCTLLHLKEIIFLIIPRTCSPPFIF